MHRSASPCKWSEEQQKPSLPEHPQEAALVGDPKEHNMQHMSRTPGSSRGPCCALGCSRNSQRTAVHVSWYILTPDSGILGKIAVFEVIKGMEKKTWKFDKGFTSYIGKKIVKCMCSAVS